MRPSPSTSLVQQSASSRASRAVLHVVSRVVQVLLGYHALVDVGRRRGGQSGKGLLSLEERRVLLGRGAIFRAATTGAGGLRGVFAVEFELAGQEFSAL